MNMRIGQGFDGIDDIRLRVSMPRNLGRKLRSAIPSLLTNACRIRRSSMGGMGLYEEGRG